MEKSGQPSNYLSAGEFQRRAAKNPTSLRGYGIRKEFITDEVKSVEESTRTIRFRISTGNPDRDRDVILPAGWKLDEFKRNSVVMYAHDYSSLPVAKAIDIFSDSTGLSATAQFATKELYPFANTVYEMIKAGFLNATSVGFRPLEWVYNEDRKGVDFMSQSLLEFSVVPVPANSECLVEARSMGIDVAQLKSWAEEVLDRWSKSDSLYVPRDQAEAVYRIAANRELVTVPNTIPPIEPEPLLETKSADGSEDAPNGETKHIPDDGEAVAKRGRVLSAANEQKLLQAHGLIGEVCAQVESPSSGEAGPLEIEDEDEEDAIEIVANKAEEGGVLIEEPEPIDLPDVSASDGTLSIDIDHDTLQRAVVETLRQSTASLGSLIERSVDAAVRRARGKVD